jgi:hypothetical protein
MSAILQHGERRVIRAGLASAAIVVVVVLIAALPSTRLARANNGPGLTVSIISPANGGGAPGQTLQAGVFAITNNLAVPQTVSSVTIAFSHPALFSSATLKPLSPNFARFDVNGPPPSPPTASPPVASTTFSFGFPVIIGPGTQPAFALEVKLSPLSRNESGNVAYAAMMPEPLVRKAGAPLWIAFAILGLATAVFTEDKRWRAWLIAGLLVLFAIGAPGCGSDSGSGGPSSTQTVTAVAAEAGVIFQVERETGVAQSVTPLPAIVAGLPLKIGTITGQ